MEFNKLISVSGYGSLYKIISKTNFGLIAESLEDGKRMPVYQSYNVSTLTDISIYKEDGEVSLKEVLLTIYEKEGGKETAALKSKDPEIKKYFESILPDYDKERVYTSDIKKLLRWYNQLVKNNAIDPEAWKKEDAEAKEEDSSASAQNDKAGEETAEASKAQGEKKVVKKEKTEAAKKKTVAKTNKPAAKKVTNAPAKKVQTVRKSGGS
jgi:hypothetical protein